MIRLPPSLARPFLVAALTTPFLFGGAVGAPRVPPVGRVPLPTPRPAVDSASGEAGQSTRDGTAAFRTLPSSPTPKVKPASPAVPEAAPPAPSPKDDPEADGEGEAPDEPGDVPVPSESPTPPSSDETEGKAPAVPDKPRVLTYPDTPVFDPAAATEAARQTVEAQRCEEELKSRGVVFSVGDSISDGRCGVLRPVSVEKLSSGVTISPSTQLLCQTALALDKWVSDDVVPASKKAFDGASVTAISHASTYVCRQRVGGVKISEHSRGSAIDIAGFTVGSRDVPVKIYGSDTPEGAFEADIRATACGPFKTVLGPGSNADHETHFHLDLAARRAGATYCR
ncbi:extensin family protein [Consotaella salsifontis]|nr:extensin family protein [Consotaella salsifontis]